MTIRGFIATRLPGGVVTGLVVATLAGLVSSGFTTSAFAESPVTWLMRLNDDAQSLNYRGSFVYRHGNQVEAMRIVRRSNRDGVMERLYSLSGASREIIRDRTQVWCYLPDENRGVHQARSFGKGKDAGFPSILPESVMDLQQFYNFELGSTGRIAQRNAQRVDIYPKDDYRYGRILWIDTQTGLLLRADLVDNKGQSVEQYMFVEVDYTDSIDDDELAPSTPRNELVWHEATAVLTKPMNKNLSWAAEQRPDGFRLVEYLRKPGTTENAEVHHLVYSDGLAAVSVFIDTSTNTDTDRILGESQMGGVNAFGTVNDGAQITAIGEVPKGTVRLLAGAMTRQ